MTKPSGWLIRGRGPRLGCEAGPAFEAEEFGMPEWLVLEWELGLLYEEEPKDLPDEADGLEEWLV